MELYIALSSIMILGLWFAWIGRHGPKRGSLAVLFRLIWLTPLALAFFPKTRYENLPNTIAAKPIHVLVDDSQSVESNPAFKDAISQRMDQLEAECLRLGCMVKKSLLSDLSQRVASGYTPLAKALPLWIQGTSGEPWVLLTDGGDEKPSLPWDQKLQSVGMDTEQKNRGIIFGVKDQVGVNLWVEDSQGPGFAFEGKSFDRSVTIHRNGENKERSVVQVQVLNGDEALATVNATFGENEQSVTLLIPLSPLAKGQHLLTIKALPLAHEVALWDNEIHTSVEVLPNTIGVLHLLGAPSWDGRFLRRYLKAEPKYDLISFFILRDPGDMQLVNERELSLIPFPVDRLFNEELPNFHIVALQNFSLYQFLEPTYQNNLVKFVKEGGGLLFVGGPRSLLAGDYRNSPLASILPFETPKNGGALPQGIMGLGGGAQNRSSKTPFYDPEAQFSIELAKPNAKERELANVYDEWAKLFPELSQIGPLSGLHMTNRVTFKKGEVTPLLEARLDNGESLPLAVASYPGKGRAIWLFTDALYKVALKPGSLGSRQIYQNFMNAAMTWLLRQEMRKPLMIRDLAIVNHLPNASEFVLDLVGAAGRYFGKEGQWDLSICDQKVDMGGLVIENVGFENWRVQGVLQSKVAGGSKCFAGLKGQHPAFGSLELQSASVVPEILKDTELPASYQKLEQLAQLTKATLFEAGSGREDLERFLDSVTGRFGVSYPNRYRMIQDHYWMLREWWFYLLLLALPLEVFTRRWPQLTNMGRRSRTEKPSMGLHENQG